MNKYKFKVNNSKLEEFIIEVEAYNFIDARQKVYDLCYRAEYCFLSRF